MNNELVEHTITAAISAKEKAYCPYSNFRVGSAVLTKTGKIFSGCNVENASYGLTTCGERVAIFNSVSNGHCDIELIVCST